MRLRFFSLFMILLLVLPTLVAQKYSDDDRIYDEVRRKLADDAEVKGAGFKVTVKNGTVTLEGRVHDERGRKKAEQITKKVKGVKGVDNQLKVFGVD